MKSANRHALIVTVALLALVAIGCVSAGRAEAIPPKLATAGGCKAIPCAVELYARPKQHGWASPQRFGAVVVRVSLFAYGDRLARTLSDGGCTGTYRGHGLVAVVKVCGKGAVPIRVTYTARTGTIFTVVYSAG